MRALKRTLTYTVILMVCFSLAFGIIQGLEVYTARFENHAVMYYPPTMVANWLYAKSNITLAIGSSHPTSSWSADSGEAQSFRGQDKKLDSVQFYLRKNSGGNPQGKLYACLTSVSGTYGTNSIPVTEMARSDPIDAAFIPFQQSGYRPINFTFTGANQILLSSNSAYCISIIAIGNVTTADRIEVAATKSANPVNGPEGNYAHFRGGVWQSDGTIDLVYAIYGNLNYSSNMYGRLIDSKGAPIADATVELEGSKSITSNENGTFSFNGLLGHSYAIKVSAYGCQTVEQQVSLEDYGYTSLGNIQLNDAQPVRVYGYVKNQNGISVGGARVALLGPTTFVTSANSNGMYDFGNVPVGSYQLEAASMNYNPTLQAIIVAQDARFDVVLSTVTGRVPIPLDGQVYNMAFCSWDNTAAPQPDAGRRDITRFVNITGKSLYGSENAGTVCVGEDFWVMRGNSSWKPLLDEGLFDVFIFSLNPYFRAHPYDTNTIMGPTATELNIVNGQYDSWLSTISQQCKNFSYPLMLKIGVEVNGNEGSGASWVGDYGQTPSAFIAAWRYIVDYFRHANVTNVDWVISYTFASVGPYDFQDYYPGNNYVDWVGVDIYQISSNDNPDQQLSTFYAWAKTLGKPLAITEWGMNWYNKALPDGDRARYLNDFFNAIETKPEFKLIRYHWNYWWRFQDDNASDPITYMPLTSQAYRTRIADTRYLTTCLP